MTADPTPALADLVGALVCRPHDAPRRTHIAMDAAADDLRRLLAIEFGHRRGWKLSPRVFSPYCLERRGRRDSFTVRCYSCWPSDIADHPFAYRADGRAAAVAAHVYDLDEAQARAWAGRQRLAVEFPTDFPSWWFPGWTRLVLFTPLK